MKNHCECNFERKNHSEYACKTCDIHFDLAENLKHHLFEVHGKQDYKCKLCKETFENKKEFLKHEAEIHKSRKQKSDQKKVDKEHQLNEFKCQLCGKYFQNENAFKMHNYVCKESKNLYQSPLKDEKPIENKSVENTELKSEQPFEILPESNDETEIKCSTCDKYFSNDLQMQNHICIENMKLEEPDAEMTEEIPANPQNYLENQPQLNNEIEPQPVQKLDQKCRICNKSFSTDELLEKHTAICKQMKAKQLEVLSTLRNSLITQLNKLKNRNPPNPVLEEIQSVFIPENT